MDEKDEINILAIVFVVSLMVLVIMALIDGDYIAGVCCAAVVGLYFTVVRIRDS